MSDTPDAPDFNPYTRIVKKENLEKYKKFWEEKKAIAVRTVAAREAEKRARAASPAAPKKKSKND